MSKLLIDGGYLIPMDEPYKVVSDGVLAIDGSRIAYAGPRVGFDTRAFKPDATIAAKGRAVLPGFVNTHIHLIGAYLKGLTEDVSGQLSAGLWKRAVPIAFRHVQDEDWYAGCLTHAMEMLCTGTTTIVSQFEKEHLAVPAVRDLGIRAVMSQEIFEVDPLKLNASVMERPIRAGKLEQGLEASRKLYEEWHGKENGRITTRISPAGPGFTSREGLVACAELADELGLGLNVHVAEVPGETEFVLARYGRRPIQFLDELGLLGERTIGIHTVFLSDEDIATVARTGMHISHTSYHVAKRGYFPPMEKVYAAGCSVAWGTDWCSNDLWRFMTMGILLPRARSGDARMLDGWRALHIATMGGARAVGMADEIGSLEAGKKADVILVDLDVPWCRPVRPENLPSNLVYNANGSDVTDVIVDGRIVVRDKKVLTVDAPAVLAETQARAERIWARADGVFAA
jgi:5-methylthioadenosine/S-adenosylhomocysteine deaminase